MSGSRLLSALELLVGAVVVVGHNVLRILPNEVPILFVLGLLSVRLRDGTLSAMGFRRPGSWRWILAVAAAAAVARIAIGDLVIVPLTGLFWPAPVAPEGIDQLTGNLPMALLALVFVWGFAAFGEEIGYRGYLLVRGAGAGGGTPLAWWGAAIVTSVLFGAGHAYKGASGMIDSGVAGLILATACLLTGRNLWTSILAHGFIDTIGLTFVYLGWDS